MQPTVLVTGGLGFIGSHFLETILEKTNYTIVCLDKETYAADIQFKELLYNNSRLFFIKDDIADKKTFEYIEKFDINFIVHFAAESHVDNSIEGPEVFVMTNVLGTFNLLEFARRKNIEKFIHVSTDEVYGSIDNNAEAFKESNILDPSSVYSSTKASSDLIVKSYFKTYKLPACITRCCNNYGPRQNKEKLLPKVILNALAEQRIPVYGKGENIREWIHVKDHCEAILNVLQKGVIGEIYNIGTGHTLTNLSLVYRVLCSLNKEEGLIEFVEDRKGHDFKYAIDSSKITNNLKWNSKIKFNIGLEETIDYYKNRI